VVQLLLTIGNNMRIKALSPNFVKPIKSTKGAGAFDIYMPEAGSCYGDVPEAVPLGFSTAIPENHVALIFPRSGVGAKNGVELNNTCGVIDSDYRGEWKAFIRTKSGEQFKWNMGDRVLQFLVVPVAWIDLEVVDELNETDRGDGGFGSSGK
jgi:dUTP pyrophosphatase